MGFRGYFMNWKKYTVIFIGTVIFSIIIYDITTMINGGVETSISYTMIHWGYDYPVFAFVMGFVMGHLFWKISEKKKE